jgi:hypothetical protein
LSAAAPLSLVRISASADVRDTTAGVPQANASSAPARTSAVPEPARRRPMPGCLPRCPGIRRIR